MKKVRSLKRAINPMTRNNSQHVPRPRIKFDGQILNSVLYGDSSITAGNISSDFHMVNNDRVFGLSRVLENLTKFYSTYKYRQVSVEWLPKVAPGVADGGSRVHIAYLDSPERMSNWFSLTDAQRLNVVVGCTNVKSFNAWERYTYNVPLTYRRKSFDVDVTVTSTTPDDFDHTTQGMIVMVFQSVSAAIVLGGWRIKFSEELMGLDASTNGAV